MKLKRIFAMLLALAIMTGLFTGCANNEDEYSEYSVWEEVVVSKDKTEKEENTPTETVSKDKDSSTSKGGYFASGEVDKSLRGTTVKYATWIEEYNTESGPVLTGFQKETGIKVELVTIPQHTYKTKLAALIQAGQAPDVYCNNDEWPNLYNLADPIEKTGINVNDKMWNQQVIKYGTVNGKAYLVNTNGSMWNDKNMVFYNKKIFSANAITTPEEYKKAGNWTWETLLKCMSDVKNCGYTGGYIDPTILGGTAGGFVKYDINSAKFSNNIEDANFQSAWKFYFDALKSEVAVSGLSKDSFIEGKAGIFMSGTYGLKKTGYWSKMDPSLIGFIEMPKMNKSDKNHPYSSMIKAWGLCKGAKNPKAAGLFLRYYLDIENYKTNGSYDSAFISKEARDFYFEINSHSLDTVIVDGGVGNLMDEKYGQYWFTTKLETASNKESDQLQTAIATIKNQVDDAVNTANKELTK